MLNLTRTVGQEIIIAPPGCEPIRLVLTRIKGGKSATIGIEAASDVRIVRAEVAGSSTPEADSARESADHVS